MEGSRKPIDKPHTKPAGGYVPLSNVQVCLAWTAYHSGILPRFYDFRVCLALHEVRARRSAAGHAKKRSHRRGRGIAWSEAAVVKEVSDLVGGAGERQVRLALGRLRKLGLIGRRAGEIRFGEPSDVAAEISAAAMDMLRRIDARPRVAERTVLVPRRLLRMICSIGKPSLAATALGVTMRCLWRRRDGLHGAGTCPASFIARVFGIDKRSAKRSRMALCDMEWLEVCNPRRAYLKLNLDWKQPPSTQGGDPGERSDRDLSLPRAAKAYGLSPPLKQEPVPGYKNQNSAPRGNPGSWRRKPNLFNVVIEDLRSLERLDSLFGQAADLQLVLRSEAGRLLVVGTAEHALRVAKRNPCGLFVAVLRKRLWTFISEDDEERARRKIKMASIASCRGVKRATTDPGTSEAADAVVAGLVSDVFRSWDARGLVVSDKSSRTHDGLRN